MEINIQMQYRYDMSRGNVTYYIINNGNILTILVKGSILQIDIKHCRAEHCWREMGFTETWSNLLKTITDGL